MLAKVSSSLNMLQLGGCYELVHQLWRRFVLTASLISITVDSSRNEALVGSVLTPDFWVHCLIRSQILFQSIILNGMFTWFLTRVIDWNCVRAHNQLMIGFEDRSSSIWVFCENVEDERVHAGGSKHHWSVICWTSQQLTFVGKFMTVFDSRASLTAISGGSNTSVECYKNTSRAATQIFSPISPHLIRASWNAVSRRLHQLCLGHCTPS